MSLSVNQNGIVLLIPIVHFDFQPVAMMAAAEIVVFAVAVAVAVVVLVVVVDFGTVDTADILGLDN